MDPALTSIPARTRRAMGAWLTMLARDRDSLFVHRDFMHFWASTALTAFGGQISLLAIPLTAITVLGASSAQMGILVALETVPFALFSLHAGVYIDRTRKMPILLASQIVLGVVLAVVPTLAWLGWLSMPVMYAVSFLLGTSMVVSGTASQVLLTQLVGRAHLVDALSKFTATDSASKLTGPGIAGALIHAIGAPFAVLFDACSFVVSWFVLRRIGYREPAPALRADSTVKREIVEGWLVVRRNRTLWSLAVGAAVWQFLFQGYQAMVTLFAARDLGLSPGAIGGAHMIGGVGALFAALVTKPLTARIGVGRPILLGLGISALAWIVLAFGGAMPAHGFAVLSLALMLLDFGVTMYIINYLALRQALTPDALLGRMTATMRFITVAPGPLGALCAGAVGEWLGLRAALTGCGLACAMLFITLWAISPVRAVRTVAALPRAA